MEQKLLCRESRIPAIRFLWKSDQRLGVSNMFKYLKKFCILDKTGIDVPGEAGTIMHKQKNVGEVELWRPCLLDSRFSCLQ